MLELNCHGLVNDPDDGGAFCGISSIVDNSKPCMYNGGNCITE